MTTSVKGDNLKFNEVHHSERHTLKEKNYKVKKEMLTCINVKLPLNDSRAPRWAPCLDSVHVFDKEKIKH